MAEVKKMATRDGYGQGLVELGAQYDNVVVLDADLAGSPRPVCSRRHIPTVISTVALPKPI